MVGMCCKISCVSPPRFIKTVLASVPRSQVYINIDTHHGVPVDTSRAVVDFVEEEWWPLFVSPVSWVRSLFDQSFPFLACFVDSSARLVVPHASGTP